jgi:1,4-alpha-glucan branching enzyme
VLEDSKIPVLTEHDIRQSPAGTRSRLHASLECQPGAGDEGARCAVRAPNARSVSVTGAWNGRDGNADPLQPRGGGPQGGAR